MVSPDKSEFVGFDFGRRRIAEPLEFAGVGRDQRGKIGIERVGVPHLRIDAIGDAIFKQLVAHKINIQASIGVCEYTFGATLILPRMLRVDDIGVYAISATLAVEFRLGKVVAK